MGWGWGHFRSSKRSQVGPLQGVIPMSRDPLETMTASAYGYVDNNPTDLTDPSGLAKVPPAVKSLLRRAGRETANQVISRLIQGCFNAVFPYYDSARAFLSNDLPDFAEALHYRKLIDENSYLIADDSNPNDEYGSIRVHYLVIQMDRWLARTFVEPSQRAQFDEDFDQLPASAISRLAISPQL